MLELIGKMCRPHEEASQAPAGAPLRPHEGARIWAESRAGDARDRAERRRTFLSNPDGGMRRQHMMMAYPREIITERVEAESEHLLRDVLLPLFGEICDEHRKVAPVFGVPDGDAALFLFAGKGCELVAKLVDGGKFARVTAVEMSPTARCQLLTTLCWAMLYFPDQIAAGAFDDLFACGHDVNTAADVIMSRKMIFTTVSGGAAVSALVDALGGCARRCRSEGIALHEGDPPRRGCHSHHQGGA